MSKKTVVQDVGVSIIYLRPAAAAVSIIYVVSDPFITDN